MREKEKKEVIIISIVLVLIAIFCIYICFPKDNKNVLENDKYNKLLYNNALTMMYETEAGSGEYQVTSDTTWPQEGYVFNEQLSACENGSELTWDDENKRVIMEANTSDKCYVYFDKKPDYLTLVNYIKNNVYTGIDGENNLYYHDGIGAYGAQEAGDNTYRYNGINPNNYICFGSNMEPCPNENLFRIIGVFDNQTKIIDINSAKEMLWGENNDWKLSLINEYLNNEYINVFSNEWQNLISETNWKIGGINTSDDIPKNIYQNEASSEQYYVAKIGLIYISDYAYGASADCWNSKLNSQYSISLGKNWLYPNMHSWTITKDASTTTNVYYIRSIASGAVVSGVTNKTINPGYTPLVKPTFYLNSDVKYISGDGSESKPFKIA